ncbi:MAG: dTDP-4-dehydrorhamnose reductase, partial [Cyanobacteria bacterium REEB65]|nr:dTDP-4-dehydrorhamnose reductase [Cyanobacteria bacterium REEB65]
TGISGMLGQDLAQALLANGSEVRGTGTRERTQLALPGEVGYERYVFDSWDPECLARQIEGAQVVIHAAAYTKVDLAEAEPLQAHRLNGLYTQTLARACELTGADLLYISSDYVFDGRAGHPYREWDLPNPQGVYGQSKLAGEVATRRLARHYIVRTSWLFGKHGPNFVATILKAARERPELRVVDDQFGCPTYTADLAEAIARLCVSRRYGTYHLTNQGVATWWGFAREIVRQAGLSAPIHPQSTAEAGRPAPRPAFSALDNWAWQVAGEEQLPRWEDALGRYLQQVRAGSPIR